MKGLFRVSRLVWDIFNKIIVYEASKNSCQFEVSRVKSIFKRDGWKFAYLIILLGLKQRSRALLMVAEFDHQIYFRTVI